MWLAWAMGLLVFAYTVALLLHGSGFDPLIDGVLSMLTQAVLLLVCWLAVARAGRGHPELLLTAIAVSGVVAANVYAVYAYSRDDVPTFPSPTDIGYLLFYALMTGVIGMRAHFRARGLAWSVLLDGAVGALGTSSVLAALLTPVLDSLGAATPDASGSIAVAYPLFGLVLALALAVGGVAASQSATPDRRWILLVLGLMIFASTDLVVAIIGDQHATGTALDAGWMVGLALVVVWVDASTRPDAAPGRAARSAAALVLPAVSTVAALGLLVLSSQVQVSPVAIALAAATLALAAVPLVSRQLALRRQLHTDDLTGLPNRRALYAVVAGRLAADRERPRALLLLDVDRFKEVNDSLGHDAGDRLLIQVGSRLASQLAAGDFLARVGGDEFAILLRDSGQLEAETAALRLRTALAAPFTLEGIALQTSASIGIALYPEHGDDLTGLLRRADMAMYKAKSGHTGHHFYRSVDNKHGATRLRTLQELRTGLADNQLILHYQPKVELRTGEVNGVEALVRWNHPTRGLLFPDQFLALAEDAGLMHSLTQVVLGEALDQAVVWLAAGRSFTVAVNLSASSLVDAQLPERVADMIESRELPASALTLEITEEFLMADRERAKDILARLRAGGIRISVDDFGTGYSSLAYLRDLPVDELKLDQSFVFPMADDVRASALVASTIDLAHGLGLRMVAEGVENEVAYDELVRYGCDYAQGYFICRPVPAADLDLWLAQREIAAGTS
jgi:diguanylate cyclase (GGDEF)-like protein